MSMKLPAELAVQNGGDPGEEHGVLESEFEREPVPLSHRHSTRSVSAVWFGFPMVLTNAVFGGIIAYHLGFWQAILAALLGNAALFAYVGALSYIAGESGLNFALQARKTFGAHGYTIASLFLSTIVVGWYAFQVGLTGATLNATYGWNVSLIIVIATVLYTAVTFLGVRALSIVGMIAAPLFIILGIVALFFIEGKGTLSHVTSFTGTGTGMSLGVAMTMVIAGFADSGTMTSDFTRWAKSGRHGLLASFSAFPVANFVSLMFGIIIVSAGAAVDPSKTGGDFMPLLKGHGDLMTLLSIAFVFVNLGSVCTHCLYNGAVGYSHIFGSKMRVLTIVLGIVGGILAFAGIWSLFLGWLSLLGVVVPPIGAVIIADQLILGRMRQLRDSALYRSTAFIAWAIGALAAVIAHVWAPEVCEALVGMIVGGVAYLAVEKLAVPQRKAA
jgi:cytosine permease